jgi:hypothetical protein
MGCSGSSEAAGCGDLDLARRCTSHDHMLLARLVALGNRACQSQSSPDPPDLPVYRLHVSVLLKQRAEHTPARPAEAPYGDS